MNFPRRMFLKGALFVVSAFKAPTIPITERALPEGFEEIAEVTPIVTPVKEIVKYIQFNATGAFLYDKWTCGADLRKIMFNGKGVFKITDPEEKKFEMP